MADLIAYGIVGGFFTRFIYKLVSSDHKKHFPGDKLIPSEVTSGQKNNILHVAAKYKGSTEVKIILGSHPLLALETNAKGDTPLHIAARLGKLAVATCLVEYVKTLAVEADYKKLLQMVNNKRNTALHEALLNGHCLIAELLIKEDQTLTSFDNEEGESPLFLAVDGGYQKTALLILGTFPQCSVSGRNGLNIMHTIIIRTEPGIIDKPFVPIKITKVISWIFKDCDDHFVGEVLAKCGSQILEIPDEFGWMPHHYAANVGIFRIFRRILKTNRSLAYRTDKEGMSALHISAKNGHTHVIQTIIKECPDVCELLDNKGRTALHTAVEHKQVSALHTFLNTIAFDDLLNDQDNDGNTALHLASTYGRYEIIMPLLVDPRTNTRTVNKKGMTAFDILKRSTVLGPFDKSMILSQWKIKHPNSFQEAATAIKDTKGRQNATSPESNQSNPEKKNKKVKKDKSIERTASINLLVATIIASITFQAAMNMPGGYDSEDGLAHFRNKTSFRYFLAFDSLAFGCSAASMIMHFTVRAQSKLRGEAYKYPIQLTTLLTFLYITSTVLAFIMGTYTVLYGKNFSGFGLPGKIAFAAFCATLLYFFLPLLAACCNYFVGILSPALDTRIHPLVVFLLCVISVILVSMFL